jgi:hypothetical protein
MEDDVGASAHVEPVDELFLMIASGTGVACRQVVSPRRSPIDDRTFDGEVPDGTGASSHPSPGVESRPSGVFSWLPVHLPRHRPHRDDQA